MYEFSYHSPASAADAAAAVGSAADPKILAGGQTLIPTMKQRLASPSDVISLHSCRDLVGIAIDRSTITIKAMTTHAAVAASTEVQKTIPALTALAGRISNPQVRNHSTIGGSVANNDPAADYPAALFALGTTVVTTKREISAEDFFTGMFETALAEDEVITSIRFPIPKAAAYAKFDNPTSHYALVGIFITRTGKEIHVAVTGAGQNSMFQATDIKTQINTKQNPDSSNIDENSLNANIHTSTAYHKHLINIMAHHTLTAC